MITAAWTLSLLLVREDLVPTMAAPSSATSPLPVLSHAQALLAPAAPLPTAVPSAPPFARSTEPTPMYLPLGSPVYLCLVVKFTEGGARTPLILPANRSKAREAPPALRKAASLAWTKRWWGIIGVGVQRAIGEALLLEAGADLIPSSSMSEEPTLTDLVSDHV